MVKRLTDIFRLDRNSKFFVIYGPFVEDSFVTSALTELNFVSLLDELLNEQGFRNNVVYHVEKSIRFLRQSATEPAQPDPEPQAPRKRIDLRKVPTAGKPPLENPVITSSNNADSQQFTIDPDNENRHVSWPNCVDYFNSIMMKQTQKRAIIFTDAQNCQFDQRFMSCFTKWQSFSKNGSICVFIYPGEETPRSIGFLESENRIMLESSDQMIKIGPPDRHEIRNLLLRKRLYQKTSLDWTSLDNFCSMFADIAKGNMISLKRIQSEEILGSAARVDQELVSGWKNGQREWMRHIGWRTIGNLHKAQDELDLEELKKDLSAVRCQQDSTDAIANKLNLWWYRTKEKPLSFVLAGTSGTGKTFTMRTLSQYLEGYGYQYFPVDLTKFQSDAEMNILIGSPPGYVGSDTRPELFAKLLETNGKLVICFDELDKAYDKIMDRLMALLADGELSWNNERGDFRQCVIGFTTNQRMDELVELKQKTLGSYSDEQLAAVLHDIPHFSSYNLGRLGSFYIYNRLTPEAITDICIRETLLLVSAYTPGVQVISLNPAFLLEVLIKSNGSSMGGRVIKDAVESRLAHAVGELRALKSGDRVKLISTGNAPNFVRAAPEEKDRTNKDKTEALRKFAEHERRLVFLDENHMASCFAHIKCQDDNLAIIKSALTGWYSIKKKDAPLTFLFVGPSGTGKTESAKTIHRILEPYGYGYYSVDCNTMQNQIDFYRIIGDPTNLSRKPRIVEELQQANNRLVICFDEVEKAYTGFFDGIMTLLHEGSLAGGNFRNCVIILTSNLAQKEIMEKKLTALKQNRQIEEGEIHDILIRCDPKQQIKETHLGRINHKCVYNHLSSDVIFDLALGKIQEEVAKRNLQEVRYVAPEVLLDIILKTEDSITGARAVENYVKYAVSPLLIDFLQADPEAQRVILDLKKADGPNEASGWEFREADTEAEYKSFDLIRQHTRDLYLKHKRKANFINPEELKQVFTPVLCQDDNIEQIIEYLRLEIPKHKERPMSMLFAGMTGTGKSFTAELIAKYMLNFGYGYHYETMTHYKSEHDASRFIGSAEGLVGSDSPPAIISKQIQYGGKLVILLDEFDKAHPSAQDMIMQLLDKGVVQSNKVSADFRKSLVILTSNAADRELTEYKAGQAKQGVGISDPAFLTGVKEILRVHGMADTLLARLGRILVYNRLTSKELAGICWNEAAKALRTYNPDIRLSHIDPQILLDMVSSEDSLNYGARPVRDKVNNMLSRAYARSCDRLQDVLEVSLICLEGGVDLVPFERHMGREDCLSAATELIREHDKKVSFADAGELSQVLSPVVCQDDNIGEIISYLTTEMAKKTRVKPMSMLFAGMTGTGKSFTAELIAKYMARFNYGYHYETMTSYKSEHDASRFIGAAEGLVGSDSPPKIISMHAQYGGKLVILLDEFDKAHPSAQDMIMQLLDKGVVQSNKVSADFRKSLVILTSNAADRELTEYKAGQAKQGVGISDPVFLTGVKEILRVHSMADTLLVRLDRILVYNPLESVEMCKICWNEAANVLREYNEDLRLCHIEPGIIAGILCSEASLHYGARPIRDKMKNLVSLAYARAMENLGESLDLVLVATAGQPELKAYDSEPDREACLLEAGKAVMDFQRKVSFANPEELREVLSPVVSQDENIEEIIEYLCLETNRKRERPMSMLFAGMTGTGKTFTAELIAKYMARFDYGYHYETMTNYKTEHDASRFVGSAEGYVGSDSPPAIIKKQIQYGGKLVILLDEFDKADPSAQDMIMQLLEKGIVQSNKISADFRKSLVILTSNAADRKLAQLKLEAHKRGIPASDSNLRAKIKEILKQAGMQDTFLGRLVKILVFNPLQPQQLLRICWQEIDKYLRCYDDKHKLLHVNPAYLADLVQASGSTEYGARSIRNVVEERTGQIYQRCHREILGVDELSLVADGDQYILRKFSGEDSIDVCLEEGRKRLEANFAQPAEPESEPSPGTDYQRLLDKGATDAGKAKIESIVTSSVGLVETDSGSGSGFLITSDGLFLTCLHVVSGSQKLNVRFEHDLESPITGRVIAIDEEYDLALIELEGEAYCPGPVELFGENRDRRNEEILVAGFPLPDELKISKVNFTKGNVSNEVSASSDKESAILYHLNCNAYPGNSGGPVFSIADKRIIGLLSGGYDNTAQGINVAVSIQAVYHRLFHNCHIKNQEDQYD